VTSPTRSVEIVRVAGAGRQTLGDRVAAEEPLAIRVDAEPYAVIMRTPGADRDLAAGFLFAERLIREPADVASIEHCADAAERENTVEVRLANPQAGLRARQRRREIASASSCGVCGRQSIDDLVVGLPAIVDDFAVSARIVAGLPARLRASQRAFDETGGLHAAGLFSSEGDLLDVAEDVGRHNAVDKVIGRALRRRQLPLARAVLCVSGRTSFEIVQKAAAAGIPLLAAVSAPTGLAIDLAERTGLTLIGFMRGDTFNVYAGARRVA